jgi:putative hydrolase of the HAD superfamily
VKNICFDWGDTLMVDFPQYTGKMKDWPNVACVTGVAETLQQLSRNSSLYLATNAAESTAEDVRQALKRGGIAPFFRAVFTFHELNAQKPSPIFFNQLVNKIGDPQLIYIGDNYQKDILGARSAALTTIWYNPGFECTPGHLPLHDAEFSYFHQLPALLTNPLLPNLWTCQQWLLEQPTSHALLMHSHTVAAIAYQLALWCNKNGKYVDPILVQRAALLHDIGKLVHDKTCQHHGETGAKILRQKNCSQIAAIIEKHPLLCLMDEQQRPQSTAEVIVYLADKYVDHHRIITLEERLAQLSVRYPHQKQEILSTREELYQLQDECCHWMGFTSDEILYQIQQALE